MAEGSINGGNGKGKGTATPGTMAPDTDGDGVTMSDLSGILREAKQTAALRIVAASQPGAGPGDGIFLDEGETVGPFGDIRGMGRDGDAQLIRVSGPFVLLQARPFPGSRAGAVTIAAGGGIRSASEPGVSGDGLTVERLIELAGRAIGYRHATGKDQVVVVGRGDLPDDLRAACEEMFGAPLDPSDSGPSTEAPTMPTWPTGQPASEGPEPATEYAPSGDDGGSAPSASPAGAGGADSNAADPGQ